MTKTKALSLVSILAVLILAGSWSYLNLLRETQGKSYWEWHTLREQGFEQLRRELRPLIEVAKGAHFNAEEVAAQARKVDAAAKAIPTLFEAVAPAGAAGPEIWASGSEFGQILNAFLSKTSSLSANPPATAEELRAAIDAIQLDCAECHRNYRD